VPFEELPAEAPPQTTERAVGFDELSRAYVALAIQGDLRGAPALFQRSVGGGAAGAALRAQLNERFIETSDALSMQPAIGEVAEDVALAWRGYWRQSLLHSVEAEQAEADLTFALAEIQRAHAAEPSPDHGLERMTVDLLERSGWHYSVASTAPWRDLYVWKTEQRAHYSVELTDLTVPVEVVFMDDFVVQGWKDFASLGLAATTGWVENDRLYCVTWAYDTASENFTVSFLKHEARHLADLRQFPDMDTVELEYRAKLTELAFANQDLQRIWNDFRAKAANNPTAAHAHANWRIVLDIEKALAGDRTREAADAVALLDVDRVNRAARRLLQENTVLHGRSKRAATGQAHGRAPEAVIALTTKFR
jgi:hypothetical protein